MSKQLSSMQINNPCSTCNVSYAASILCLTTSTLASAAIDSADDPSAYNNIKDEK